MLHSCRSVSRGVAVVVALSICSPAWTQTVGLVPGSFIATYVPKQGGGCSSLLVTGQFLAATSGWKLDVTARAGTPTLLELEVVATPPVNQSSQVLTTMPVTFSDSNYNACHYGVSLVYRDQRIVVGLTPVGRYER